MRLGKLLYNLGWGQEREKERKNETERYSEYFSNTIIWLLSKRGLSEIGFCLANCLNGPHVEWAMSLRTTCTNVTPFKKDQNCQGLS